VVVVVVVGKEVLVVETVKEAPIIIVAAQNFSRCACELLVK
jgi:ribosomal protein L18E